MKFLETAYPAPVPPKADEVAEKASGLIAELEKVLKEQSKPYNRKSKGFSPSETNPCARLAVYKMEGVDVVPDVSPQLQRIFDNGNSVHARITNYFAQATVLVSADERLPLNVPPISGLMDVVARYDGMTFVVEIKSINNRGFEARANMRAPKDDHYRQIQLYMHETGIHQGIVFYENKDNQDWLTCVVTYNESYVKEILDRYDRIYQIHLKGDIPKRPHKQTTKICQGCSVKDRCWTDDREGTEKL